MEKKDARIFENLFAGEAIVFLLIWVGFCVIPGTEVATVFTTMFSNIYFILFLVSAGKCAVFSIIAHFAD